MMMSHITHYLKSPSHNNRLPSCKSDPIEIHNTNMIYFLFDLHLLVINQLHFFNSQSYITITCQSR